MAGAKLALIGSALGLLGSFGLTRLLAAVNPGMHFDAPFVSIAAIFLLIAVALIASWLPARRAAHINPIEALRAE